VPFFLDRQLAGPFGRGDHYFLGGPWKKGAAEQGYQLRFSPAQLYRAAIKAVDAYCAGLMEELDDSFHKATRVQAQLDYAERLGLGSADWRALAVSEIG